MSNININRNIQVSLVSQGLINPLVFSANGTTEQLKITFSVEKQLIGVSNRATIEIYNVSVSTIQALMNLNTAVEVELSTSIGSQQLTSLAKGTVVGIVPTLQLPEYKLTLTLINSYIDLSSAVLSRSYGPNTWVPNIVRDLVNQMTSVTWDYSRTRLTNYSVGSKGYSVNGRVSNELDKLARAYNFSWSVQNGKFQAIQDGTSTTVKYPISLDAGNLFNIKPILQDVMIKQVLTAVQIEAYLNPAILPGDVVVVKSGFISNYDGEYKVHVITFDGSSHDDEWKMTIQSKKF